MRTDLKEKLRRLVKGLRANKGNTKGRLILFLFRLGRLAACEGWPRFVFMPFSIFYTVFVQYLLGVDIPLSAKIGGGLKLFHGVGIVVHPMVVIGDDCVLRHGVTLGEKISGSCQVPVVGCGVEFGCNSVVLGSVVVGDWASIGACSLVLSSVPTRGVMVGAPARLVKVLT